VHADLSLADSDEFMDDLCRRFGFGEIVDSRDGIEARVAATVALTDHDWMVEGADESIADEVRYSFVRHGDGWLHTPDRETLRTLYRVPVDAHYFPNVEIYDHVDIPIHLIQARDGLNALTDLQIRALTARRGVTVHHVGGGLLGLSL